MELSLEQKYAAENVLRDALSNGLSTLGGYAGTGKTTILSHLYEQLPNWMFVAYTGKAASNLRKKGVRASTIHSAIYKPVGEDPPEWELKKEVDCDGFAIDEASMVGSLLLKDLKSFGKPIIAVGDHGQLPPVKDEAGLMVNPDHRLEKIHRNAGPIAQFAEWLREGEPASEWRGGGINILNLQDVTMDQLLRASQIITAFNEDRRRINAKMRKALGYTGRLMKGERVIVLKNHRRYAVFNGQQGVVTWMTDKKLSLDTGHTFPYTFEEHNYGVWVDHAYCLTCHKAQGDEFDSVLVFEPRVVDLWPHNKWTYTAASRAKQELTWVLQ